MSNQHPKYGQSNWEHRRDNSFGKRQWRKRKVMQNLMHSSRYMTLAGFYRCYWNGCNGRYKFYSYNNSSIRNYCNRIIRRYKGEITRPGMYKIIKNYVNKVW